MKRILLVNPFSSRQYLSDRLAEYNIWTTVLDTVDFTTLPPEFHIPAGLFNEQIKYQSENVDDIIQQLGNRKFDYVINGCEAYVKLSDKLAEFYTPHYANNPHTSNLRSNKYDMHQTLANAGVSHIKQIIYDTQDELPVIEDLGLSYPCFVKPLAGVGTFNACKIDNVTHLKTYLNQVPKVKYYTQSEHTRNKFLIAELIQGDELFVDVFSINGIHHISTIQRYCKNIVNDYPIYKCTDLEYNIEIKNKVTDYIKEVLTLTGFNNGFSHTELFLLNNNECKLIEINPRISGTSGMINKMSLLYSGIDAISLLMKYVYDVPLPVSNNIYKYYRQLELFNFSGNSLYNLRQNVQQYSSFCELLQIKEDGHIISKAINQISLFDAVAFVILRSNDMSQLEHDNQAILNQDKLGWK